MRGIFERPPGSGVWWVSYFRDGKRHREKVGRKSDARDLYQHRKAEGRAGVKLPVLRGTKGVTVGELIDDALVFVKDHKDYKGYVSKAAIVREAFGSWKAENLKPSEINSWLERFNTPADEEPLQGVSEPVLSGRHRRRKGFGQSSQTRAPKEGANWQGQISQSRA